MKFSKPISLQSKQNGEDENNEIQQEDVEIKPDLTASNEDEAKPVKRKSFRVFSIDKESINRKLTKVSPTKMLR